MENTILSIKQVENTKIYGISNGWIIEGNCISNGDEKVYLPIPADNQVGFFAAKNGNTFKVISKTGDVYVGFVGLDGEHADCAHAKEIEWDIGAEFKEETLLGCIFNEENGNILFCSESSLSLVDKDLNLIKEVLIPEKIKEKISREEKISVEGSWSPDGKYILIRVGAALLFFGYDMTEISDTFTSCNRVMNSRLMRTKKYLEHESSYVDIVKRVPTKEDIREEHAINQKEEQNVLFEEVTSYKLCRWHNQFSLVYAVTEENRIFLLERNSLKYKEIQYIRKSDQKKEKITENLIIDLFSDKDYLYIIHRENNTFFLKVYRIKNNTVYLKAEVNLTKELENPIERIISFSLKETDTDSYIRIICDSGEILIRKTHITNRTATEVIEVDGCMLLFSSFSKHIIPPPFFSFSYALPYIPKSIKCSSSIIEVEGEEETRKYPAKEMSSFVSSKENLEELFSRLSIEKSIDSLEEISEIPNPCTDVTIPFGESTALLTYCNSQVTITYRKNIEQSTCSSVNLSSVTSVALCKGELPGILVSHSKLSSTEILFFTGSPNGEIERIFGVKTGRDSKILFVAHTYVILINEYEMLETFHLSFLLQKSLKSLAQEKSFKKAVVLCRRHGLSLSPIYSELLLALHSDLLSLSLLADITKLCLTPNPNDQKMIREIEKHLVLSINTAQSKEHPKSSTPISDTILACETLTEIFLNEEKHDKIVLLAKQFISSTSISPYSFSSSGYTVPLSILRKSLPVVTKEKLLSLSLEEYAYDLAYLLLHTTDSPQDETNELLLPPGRITLDITNIEEEIERRRKIAIFLRNKRKEVLYTVKKMLLPLHPKELHEKLPSLVLQLKTIFEKARIRDYYAYLVEQVNLKDDPSYQEELLFGTSLNEYFLLTSSVLVHAGDDLLKETSLEEALSVYQAAGSLGKLKADALRIRLGLWKDLFIDPNSVTKENLEKIEGVLLSKKDILGIAEMHCAHGNLQKALLLLVDLDAYEKILEITKKQEVVDKHAFAQALLTRTEAHLSSIQDLPQKYVENRSRLLSVRERKDKEREELAQGFYADEDFETTAYTRSFITNTFMSNAPHSSKKKRSSKLRNKVGGRYEEEYVQYVLSELIKKSIDLVKNIQSIEKIFLHSLNGLPNQEIHNSFSHLLSSFKNSVETFSEAFLPSLKDDFLSMNHEEDPLFDPERPLIQQPEIMDISLFLQQ
ncbi:hypothetical protein NEFER03_0822 [Nematocida sp. LUAm3]|nr:hypothetical protein NEFER03_0822 [Nematocida sp. LUAm3]KAI5174840.1 hypothetical protein NEFER02_0940 [Nematocida sp. LUAm2]KAI5177562.1 hypothetical protein NEFER01_0812 [Nematocida sp. LUAm1]